MNTQAMFGDWSVWSGPLMQLQQINQEAAEKVIRECISYCSDNAATVVKCTQTMPRTTSPEDFFNTQMKLWTQQGQKNLDFFQNIFKIYQDTLKDHCTWTEEKVSAAMKNVSRPMKKHTEE